MYFQPTRGLLAKQWGNTVMRGNNEIISWLEQALCSIIDIWFYQRKKLLLPKHFADIDINKSISVVAEVIRAIL